MATNELVDDRVSLAQCKKAVEALHKHATERQAEKEKTELLPGKEQNIWLNVTVKKIHAERKFKPTRIPIKYPLVDPRTSGICLIVKDPQREYKDLLESHGIKFISRVVGITKLKGKFKPFEARRMLLKENALFLVDDRVVEMMPKLLGVKWFEAKKQPIPVNMKKKDLKGELERAISSSYMNQNKGTYTSIKIANLSHTPSQILTNLQLALPAVAKAVSGGWDNIQSFNIKTNSSAALPIWSCDLGDSEGGRWAGLTAGEDNESKEEEAMEVEESPAKPKKGSKKRSTEDVEEAATPRKKAKSTEKVEPTPAAATDTSKAKSKKGKGKTATSPETAKTDEAAPSDSTPANKAGKSKSKTDKITPKQPTSAAITTAIETPVAAVVAEKSKKPKKARATAADLITDEEPREPAPTPATPTEQPKESTKKDKKTKKKAEEAAKDDDETPSSVKGTKGEKKGKETLPESAPTLPSGEVKKSKKTSKITAKETEAEVAPAVERKKEKKIEEAPVSEKVPKKVKAGDKKKEKALSKNSMKSAKNELLKKKAGH